LCGPAASLARPILPTFAKIGAALPAILNLLS
jgi:hypothetical protein